MSMSFVLLVFFSIGGSFSAFSGEVSTYAEAVLLLELSPWASSVWLHIVSEYKIGDFQSFNTNPDTFLKI
jgi:hypothetical protein